VHPDRLLPADPATRAVGRQLYEAVAGLPLVAVHGHVDAALLAADRPWSDPAELLVTSDHYVLRVLHSVGVPLEALGQGPGDHDPRAVWRALCEHWDAFRGTSIRLWLDQELSDLLDVELPLRAETADASYDALVTRLAAPEYRPRALLRRFGLEVLSTTDAVGAGYEAHDELQADGLNVVPTLRPDALTDPLNPGWADAVGRLGVNKWSEFVDALRAERLRSAAHGAVATDHGHTSPATADLSEAEAAARFDRLRLGTAEPGDAEALGAHLLTMMAVMALDDGLVMQLHTGVLRNHDRAGTARYGSDTGSDFPLPVSFTTALRPLLERCGNEARLRLVVFTVDETTYSRELAPMASYYPGLYLGAPWWFLDAPDAMARHFSAVAETAGYAKLSGFVDDTRAFCSIPARHDVARRTIAGHLARLVAEHRLSIMEATDIATDYAYRQPKALYRL
jgi:glucuronate isomerase